MTSRIGARSWAAALALLAGGACALAPAAFAADLYGMQPVMKAPPPAARMPPPPQQQGGDGWYQGCWNCMPSASPGVSLGIANGPVVVGAVPPPIYYAQPPRVYLNPVPEVYVQGPVGPMPTPPGVGPRGCWVPTGPGGIGYWTQC
ncbi:hypothetical protein [Xanthobacter sediminis]